MSDPVTFDFDQARVLTGTQTDRVRIEVPMRIESDDIDSAMWIEFDKDEETSVEVELLVDQPNSVKFKHEAAVNEAAADWRDEIGLEMEKALGRQLHSALNVATRQNDLVASAVEASQLNGQAVEWRLPPGVSDPAGGHGWLSFRKPVGKPCAIEGFLTGKPERIPEYPAAGHALIEGTRLHVLVKCENGKCVANNEMLLALKTRCERELAAEERQSAIHGLRTSVKVMGRD